MSTAMKNFIARMISTGIGVGHLPLAPGTFGSLLGVAIAIAFHWLERLFWLPHSVQWVSLFAACAVGTWAAGRTSMVLKKPDASEIVIDEITGQWIALLPIGLTTDNPWKWAVGFALFRFFDIFKPWPIRALDRWSKSLRNPFTQGFGIMADDWLAALFVACLLFWMV